MTEWHVTPDYIINNWTDELFDLMVEKLVERKDREAVRSTIPDKPVESEEMFFARASNMIKVVKKHGD